jgi:hypothetical protein
MIKKYHLLVYGDPMQLLPGCEKTITTAVFRSSYCKTNTIIFDNVDDASKVKSYLKGKGVRSVLQKDGQD